MCTKIYKLGCNFLFDFSNFDKNKTRPLLNRRVHLKNLSSMQKNNICKTFENTIYSVSGQNAREALVFGIPKIRAQ